ncbi:MAG: hypothetical protein ACTSQY_02925 [Candidatus Odinarchaeia archaeon]
MSKKQNTKRATKKTAEKKTAEKIKNTISKGDFILVDLIGRVKETNELVDITIEEIAKKEKVYDQKTVYKPRFR